MNFVKIPDGICGIENTNLWWRDPGSNWGHTDFQLLLYRLSYRAKVGVLNNVCLHTCVKANFGFEPIKRLILMQIANHQTLILDFAQMR